MKFHLYVKPGANINKTSPEMFHAMFVTAQVYENYGYPCVVTSGQDGVHGPGTLHPKGNAHDYRIWNLMPGDIPIDTLNDMYAEIRDALGKDYDVVLEKTHGHIEYQPHGEKK